MFLELVIISADTKQEVYLPEHSKNIIFVSGVGKC